MRNFPKTEGKSNQLKIKKDKHNKYIQDNILVIHKF